MNAEVAATGFKKKMDMFMVDLVTYGNGEIIFKVITLKDNRRKVTIEYGKSHIDFIDFGQQVNNNYLNEMF